MVSLLSLWMFFQTLLVLSLHHECLLSSGKMLKRNHIEFWWYISTEYITFMLMLFIYAETSSLYMRYLVVNKSLSFCGVKCAHNSLLLDSLLDFFLIFNFLLHLILFVALSCKLSGGNILISGAMLNRQCLKCHER